MPVTIKKLTIQPDFVAITAIDNLTFGRHFKVENCLNGNSTIVTMKELYRSALDSFKANKENKVVLEQLKDYVQSQIDANQAANLLYANAGCGYLFLTFFARVFGLTLHVNHEKRLNALMTKLNDATKASPSHPVQISPWENVNEFTNKVYKPLPAPKKFEGPLMTEHEFTNILHIHDNIVNERDNYGNILKGLHGHAYANLLLAFRDGMGNRTQGGPCPFFDNTIQNTSFHNQFKQTMTLTSRMDKSAQQVKFRVLAEAFKNCNTGRIDTVQQISNQALNTKVDFETRIQLKINGLKRALFDLTIREMAPPFDINKIEQQLPHLTSGYLAAVGTEIGLTGVEYAKADSWKYEPNSRATSELLTRDAFIKKFKRRCNEIMTDIANDIAGEINDPNSLFHSKEASFGTWEAQKVINGELDETFAYYSNEKSYPGIKEPSKDQINKNLYYISNAEVKHILGMLGYLQDNHSTLDSTLRTIF